jgi:hypothetical protein
MAPHNRTVAQGVVLAVIFGTGAVYVIRRTIVRMGSGLVRLSPIMNDWWFMTEVNRGYCD